MATDFTQDTVLHFLQSRGGSVKNSELLQHFRAFLREHPDRDRNREFFKKFVNSVATVQQVDGASCVVLRKKYRGHVPGTGATGERSRVRPAAENSRRSPAAGGSDKPPPPPQVVRQGEASEVVSRKTVLPAAGIVLHNHNNNNVVNLKPQHVPVGPRVTQPGSPAQRSEVKTAKLPVPGSPPGVAPAPRQNGSPGYLEQHPVAVTPSSQQQDGGLERPPRPEVSRRHLRHRQSYKTAVSYDEDDDDDDEEEESSQIKQGSAGGRAARPLNAPLASTVRALSASTPSITEPPAVSPLSRKKVPHIYIQGTTEEVPSVPGSVPAGHSSPGSPLQAERRLPPSDASPQQNLGPYSHPSGSPLGPGRSPTGSGGARLSSSHSSLLTPSPSPTRMGSPGPNSRGSPWNSSYEDLPTRTAGGVESSLKIDETQRPRVESAPRHANIRDAAHWYHSSDNLYQEPVVRAGRPWHHSTGNLQDDPSDGGSSDGPAFPLTQQQQKQQQQQRGGRGGRRPSRVSSQLRSRMCRSMGADLDQLLQEEEESGRGHEAARLGRLALLSSSLSLGRHLSSSSLSSCHSLGELADEGPQGRKSFPPDSFTSTSYPAQREHTSKQSLVPLEPREHDWLVKGAAGAWPDIYALFREDPSLLNRQDFISGYTVLHWIAKHGDHRVLNTLWYGVEKSGLSLDVNARSASGYTPLHLAAMHGHKNMLRLLVGKFQADVNRRDNAGKKPWQYLSSSTGCTSREVWQLLGATPPSPNSRDGGGGGGGAKVAREQQQQQQRQRRKHHFSSASSGERPTVIPSSRVKRSTSLAAFLKHKTMQRFQGHQSDSSL